MGLNIGKGLLTADKDIYGRKPIVPELDFLASYGQTVSENQQLLPQVGQLQAQTNQVNFDALTNLFQQLDPNYRSTIGRIGENIASRTRGEIPLADIGEMGRENAAWQIGSGTGGAGIGNARMGRNLGLRSYDIQRQGEQDWASFINNLRRASMPEFADVRDYAINPAARLEQDWNRDWLAAQVTAAPDPAKRGQFDSKMALMGMILSAYGGGPGYQGTYRPQYGGGGGGGGGGGWWSRQQLGGGDGFATQSGPIAQNPDDWTTQEGLPWRTRNTAPGWGF